MSKKKGKVTKRWLANRLAEEKREELEAAHNRGVENEFTEAERAHAHLDHDGWFRTAEHRKDEQTEETWAARDADNAKGGA